ncbi:hypothetical protein [Bdellovibrio sp. HCB2-146]|uniref:hypothetical protein n=1 Tax=Bdellovibrio sp. HCB2-146 TaxID=3394362 RepID=UPI0039BC6871
MKSIAVLSAALLLSVSAQASTCGELRQELDAMKKAQQQMMDSLVNNHETFASTMEEYSTSVSAAKGGPLNKTISKKMGASAQAFRVRGIQGRRMAQKFERASDDLMERVAACLR